MDLGIAGRSAILCASSRGLGFVCANALAREGVNVTINGRNQDALDEAARTLTQRHSVRVTKVLGDITDPSVQQALLDACPEPDILVNNNGGPPPGNFGDWGREQWISALDGQMLAPLAMIRLVVDGMVERQFGRIINITSAMVKSPRLQMGLSVGARSGLTSVSKALSREVVRSNVTINNLLPERIDTGRQQFMAKRQAEMEGITVEQAYAKIADTIAAKRLGRPEEFADACAFLCSAQAGFISGQNLQLDGGSYAGVF